MAMEKLFTLRETHTRAITALGYNPIRREIMIGCEDGIIKTCDTEAGRLISTSREHRGWVTDFLYWAEPKLMLSAANDGILIAWGSGGGVYDKVTIGQPVYCMTINPRRHQLLCGVTAAIRVYDLDPEKESGHIINPQVVYVAKEHQDIVRCLLCHESRVYSAGYDQKMIIYDSSFTGKKQYNAMAINNQAHDAGISNLILVKDNENNTWIVTGSFDKTVKIWSTDGKLVHPKREGFLTNITGLCYVPRNKTIWVAGGTSYAYLYDPKSGDNVSDFIGTFHSQEEEKYTLQLLKYFPEQNQVVASTSRRHLIVWKYNPSGCVTALKCKSPIESLAYTHKVPILIFSGDAEGVITKWERMQSNHFMYSKEMLNLTDAKKTKRKKKDKEKEGGSDLIQKNNAKNLASHYQYNTPMVAPVASHHHRNTSILRIVFVEELDLIVASCDDSHIYCWGFDDEAVQVLKNMKPPEENQDLARKFSVLLNYDSDLRPEKISKATNDEDSVTNRVAGFVCRYILSDHSSCVTSLAVVPKNNQHGIDSIYLVSAGWDRRICIWDLHSGRLHDVFRNSSLTGSLDHVELACDGIITDLTYCQARNEIAYASSDKMVYIRRFSPEGRSMVLLNTLQGHYSEVTCVTWNPLLKAGMWVTGSEDGTIRIWGGDGMNECEQVLGAQGAVTCLCMDKTNGAIIAGVQHYIRVYEPEQFRLVQTNKGHTDSVRTIVHIKERNQNQYVSTSWDRTVRIWNTWKKPVKRQTNNKDKKRTSSMMILESQLSLQDENKTEGEEPTVEGEESAKQAAESGQDSSQSAGKDPPQTNEAVGQEA